MSAQTLHAMGSIQSRQVGAIMGTSQALQSSSGAQYAGEAATGAMISGLGGSISQMGGMMAGAMSGAAKPPTPSYNQSAGQIGPLNQNGSF
jgi:hypothetical protein